MGGRLDADIGDDFDRRICCDANPISNAMTAWLVTWTAKGWRKGDGKRVEIRGLRERMEQAAVARCVGFGPGS